MNEKEKKWIRKFYFGPGTLLVDKTGNRLNWGNHQGWTSEKSWLLWKFRKLKRYSRMIKPFSDLYNLSSDLEY